MWLNVMLPAAGGTSPTLDVELEFCDEAATTTQVTNANMKQQSAAGHYTMPFFTDLEYLQVKLVTGGTSPNFGAAEVWISPAPIDKGKKY